MFKTRTRKHMGYLITCDTDPRAARYGPWKIQGLAPLANIPFGFRDAKDAIDRHLKANSLPLGNN
jgi:hypothetical protein